MPAFIRARQKDIRVLEKSQLKSKYASSTRVFQSLPRTLRRRTASHNVRRVPKRMRPRALKEMGLSSLQGKQETKGVSGTGQPLEKKHPRGRVLYNLRRRTKLLKYAARHKQVIQISPEAFKSVKMRDRLKVLKAQIEQISGKPAAKPVLSNLAGAYDNTGVNARSAIHRVTSLRYATRQTRFKWLPTHVWHAKRAKMVKRWGWQLAMEPTMKCFRRTSRSSRTRGCVAWDVSYISTFVLTAGRPVLEAVVREIGGSGAARRLAGGKAWEGVASIGDEPVCMGSLLQADGRLMVRVHPSAYDSFFDYLMKVVGSNDGCVLHDDRYSVGSIKVAGPKALEALESVFHARDPSAPAYKLWRAFASMRDTSTIPAGTVFSFMSEDPRLWTKSGVPNIKGQSCDSLIECIMKAANGDARDESVLSRLLTIEGREESYRNLQTIKQLGRRRTPEISGQPIKATANDPLVPVCVIKRENSYDVVLPWFWVMPVWYQLVHVPHVMLGGLRQMDQLRYERGQLGAGDLVFTRSGFVNSRIRMVENARIWNRKPKSKRVQYDSLMLGPEKGELMSPFGCDWRSLQVLRYSLSKVSSAEVGPSEFDSSLNRVIKTKYDAFQVVGDVNREDRDRKAAGRKLFERLPIRLVGSTTKLNDFKFPDIPALPVRAIEFRCSNRGNIKDGARIYEVPAVKEWGMLRGSAVKDIRGRNVSPASMSVPGSEHLIGFATSATFNLVHGCSTGVGFIDGSKEVSEVIVRNIGSNVCYVCEVVKQKQ